MIDFIKDKNTRKILMNYLSSNLIFRQRDYTDRLNKKIPNRLFRYNSLNEYVLSNLRENKITVTNPELFNDVYDGTIHRNTFPYIEKRIEELNSQLSSFGHSKIEMDMKHLKRDFEKRDRFFMTYIREDIRVSCFSEDEKSILMWSHYANNNQGICVEYDFTKKLDIIFFLYPIIYLDNPIDFTSLLENPKNKDIEISVLLSTIIKSKVWEYEKEWRLIFYFGGGNKLDDRVSIINIPVPKTIYLGNKFIHYWAKQTSTHIFDEFCDYIESNNIPIKIMQNKILSYEFVSKQVDVNLLRKLDKRLLE